MRVVIADDNLLIRKEIAALLAEAGVLSQHVEYGVATRVLAEQPARLGYRLKERVTDVDDFVGALHREVRLCDLREARPARHGHRAPARPRRAAVPRGLTAVPVRTADPRRTAPPDTSGPDGGVTPRTGPSHASILSPRSPP